MMQPLSLMVGQQALIDDGPVSGWQFMALPCTYLSRPGFALTGLSPGVSLP